MTRTLLLHMGTGKTGSTAIQGFLALHRDQLRGMGVHYWGLNLEGAFSPPSFEWQHPQGVRQLQRLEARSARKQLKEALARAVKELPDGATAVWSNEAIHERPHVYVPLLRQLRDVEGVHVVPIAYVRNHRDYARSAYFQWGVRHKGYPGRVMGFGAWSAARAGFLCYGRSLAEWKTAFPRRIRFVNYDAVGDVVEHFVGFLPEAARSLSREQCAEVNASPSARMLALAALFNNLFPDAVDPRQFDLLLRQQPLLKDGLQPEFVRLSSLVPAESDLDRVEALLAEDSALVNELLVGQGEPPFGSAAGASRRGAGKDVDLEALASDLLSTLMRIVVAQDETLRAAAAQEEMPWSRRVVEATRMLLSSPRAVAARASGRKAYDPYVGATSHVRIIGHLDRFDGRSVEGWVAVENRPELRLAVELVLDGEVIASAVADQVRPDLRRKGIGGGACSFRIGIPPETPLGARGSIQVRIAGGVAFLLPDSKTAKGPASRRLNSAE